ncbi:zinc transporter ZIP4 [Stegastes partitus]|uniref:Zinc transporter ZIP4 n=2 Tax=Stegastes partitus TaxID=144197 RepID=A0A9Y4TRL3_9TELE|nr:PREDICTED: zinc transporter ZIP4 [Stegastes partitus]
MFSRSLSLLALLCGALASVSGSPAVEEAYEAVVSVVSPGQQHLTGDSLRTLFNTLEHRVQCGDVPCGKCDLLNAVDQLIGNHSAHEAEKVGENETITVSQFTRLASGSVLYLTAPGPVCTAVSQGRWDEETEHFLHKITVHDHDHHKAGPHRAHTHMDSHGVEAVILELRRHYKPTDTESCVTTSDIMADVNATATGQEQEVGAVLGRVLYYALQGRCFAAESLPEESFFLDYIMHQLGSHNFTVEGLAVFMKSLNIGPDTDHDEDHGHVHSVDEHVHNDHSGQRLRKRSRSGLHEKHETNTTWDHHCFSAEDLVLIYSLPENSSASSLGPSDMARLSPALVQQILSGACTGTMEPVAPDGLTKTERYLYATAANLVITLAAMLGIVMLLCTSCTYIFQLSIQFCISMAVGSLTGDALLHLLPMFLGLHVHGAGEDHSSHSHGEGVPDYLYKMLVLIAGIYYFYLMETIFSLITHKNKKRHHELQHGEDAEPHHCDHGRVLEMYQQERKSKSKVQSASKANLVGLEDNEKSLSETKKRSREQRLLPYLITVGDGLHNFADGLAIGAAFSMSWRSGLATSLAVLCHELPHELGDFAIMLHCGVSVRKALLLNVGSAMTSFVGLYIALSVATDIVAQQWIAAVTAGLFLYVGLADMLPTMIHIDSDKPWLMLLLQNVGLLTGWSILLLLSLYEGKINF